MPPAPAKTLIVAEKPSVAGDIARALGGMKGVSGQRGIDFYEGGEYVVSSAVGHLLEMSAPEKFEVKRGKWSLSNLPVLPDYFELSPIKESAARLRALQKLYRRDDIAGIVNACDAGREGELIFYNLMRYLHGAGKKGGKPVRRLWLSSMTPTAIRAGFDKLREGDAMRPLQNAAVCRAEADWLVGINATRAMTAMHSAAGGFSLTTVGRVQTPTLAILVERERRITAFKPRDYWEVRATFAAAAGEYTGLWFDPAAAKSDDKDDKPERVFDSAAAARIVAECRDKDGRAEEKKRPSSEAPPPLFDLTSLQREANARFGLPARATLGAAQALYERHKMITYPRTDSKALPEDYPAVVKKTLAALSRDGGGLEKFARAILDKNMVAAANRKIFNNAKVSDHFAIVPTGEMKKTLRDIEQKIYRTILLRFLSAFYPPAKYEITERRTAVERHLFLTKGRILISPGWREVGGQTPKDAEIAPIAAGETVAVSDVQSEQKRTLPPPRYNEATLLAAMEGAGKFVEDEELREAMRERGMGTPATRASIIEGLVRERYVLRDGRELLPTPKAQSLLRLLRALKVEDLTLPAMTGEWEYKLRRIEQSDFDREKFMDEIRALTRRIVSAAKECGEVENVAGDYAALAAKCPSCGGEVRESHRRFSCRKCEFFIWKTVAGREFSVAEAERLLRDGETPELEGFRSRIGREFAAAVFLRKGENDVWRAMFDFDRGGGAELSPEELREKESVGPCPKCGAPVRDAGARFICEKTPACDFGMARRLLQREIKPAEIAALLRDGKTALLAGFISKKTRRPFSAHLTMNLSDNTGKLGFEFAPRPAAKSAAPKTAAKKTAKKPSAKKSARKPSAKSS
ncbi:MAG: DNA topoisomerase III [Gammaproteobacteria bacterium]